MMSTTFVNANSATLKVPGAKIYYEVQGDGPVLLMIPGGPADAGAFADLAPLMAERYKTVRYDPRGNSRSVLDGPPQDQDMDEHGDDAAALIAALGDQPAIVLGSSGGAQIGLNLAARYPKRVRVLVAHEPPCLQLLPDAEVHRRNAQEVLEVFRTSGAGPAMQKFAAMAGLGGGTQKKPPSPSMQESFSRMQGNFAFFLAHGVMPIGLYTPDISALAASKVRVVVGVGAESEGQLAWRSAMALAMRMGLTPVTFPGGHGGYGEEPGPFARKLEEVLTTAI
jgi:pimeloyl-ACP methyl ester carboxylesterase